ncbi:uncharacterized protein B0J16DRAFT_415294 [Fusarium flagelliforme]|uniref:uncharacterized protein n=1 Tax=Fusarium flagelliforme TaxID=2675880 RepID=UPI001E8D20D8|nr:uncharacterized protein B0J16DRAFT_415294 [Fusarium flagelliforme]KAH7185997.1 hypothetical protein B0J16DRAFT_415294 [Fusarium flagelliforme]
MISWQEFARYRASKDTFLKRITTLEDFSNACTNSSFLAIRIKDIKKTSDSDRVLAQVGLAYLPSLEPDDFLDCSSANMPSLIQFYNNKRVKALTVDVPIPQEEKDQILGLRDMPVRRNVRFGKQVMIHSDNLGAAITGYLQGCFHDNNRNLVCVSLNSKAWTYMRDYFPGAMSHFSAYMDLEDIARDAAPYSGHIPGLKNCLELFHFNGELAGTEKVGEKTDNAGEHAVAVCAFANILLSSENQEKFKYRIECASIARHWESKEVRLIFSVDAKFIVSVRTEARESLPSVLKSSWRIAQEFHAWNPRIAVRIAHSEAHVQFHNKPDMQTFINDMNGAVYASGEILSVMTYEEREKERQQEPGQQDCGNQEEDGQQECRQQQENQQHARGCFEQFLQQHMERHKQAWCSRKEDQLPQWAKNRRYPSARELRVDDETEDEWCRQQKIQRLASRRQTEEQPNYWYQKEDWAQEQKCDIEKKENQQEGNQQQQETQEKTAWNTAREYWPSEEASEEESEEEEEEEDDDEMPELVEADPEADWEVLSDWVYISQICLTFEGDGRL